MKENGFTLKKKRQKQTITDADNAVDLVKGDPKALFSIATTQTCWGGRYSIPWIAPLTLDPYLKRQ